MERVRDDGDWTLMCPNECPGLMDVWGNKFNELYLSYVRDGKGRQTIKARTLWQEIVDV
jgi:ribonucleoside-diphosphate reductase alpha chain